MIGLVRNVVQRRELLWVLLMREFSGRYRQSYLGLGWAVIQPVMLTFLVVGLRAVLAAEGFSLDETAMAFVSVLPWTYFANSLIFATASITRGGGLLKKIYFPREIFVVAAVMTCLVDFAVAGAMLVPIMALAGHGVNWHILWIPLLVFVMSLLAVAVGLVTGAAAVYKRDIMYGLPFVMQFWMVLSPVWYTLDEARERLSPRMFMLYLANPLAGLLDAFRRALYHGLPPDPGPTLYATAATLVVLALCYEFFKRVEPTFADVV